MLKTKACPCCAQPHGYSNWKAFNSSVLRPLRCQSCHAFFHQVGLRTWFLSTLIPIEVWLILPWALAFALLPAAFLGLPSWLLLGLGIVSQLLLTMIYVDRRYPLAAGPKHG